MYRHIDLIINNDSVLSCILDSNVIDTNNHKIISHRINKTSIHIDNSKTLPVLTLKTFANLELLAYNDCKYSLDIIIEHVQTIRDTIRNAKTERKVFIKNMELLSNQEQI